jgi:hypothetical protein
VYGTAEYAGSPEPKTAIPAIAMMEIIFFFI